jgi:hypothetical protein
MVCRLSAGGRWILTSGTAAQKPWICAAFRGIGEALKRIPDGSALLLLRLEPLHRAGLGHGLWLAALRSGVFLGGYMARVEAVADEGFLLVEDHCPICAAAMTCQGFCSVELQVFRNLLGPGCQIERQDHLLTGARRYAYRITPAA